MLGTCVNVLFLGSYKQLTQEMYFELKAQVILVSFLVPILSSQTLELRKKYQKKPENKSKVTTSRDIRQFFEFNKYDYIIVIIINTLFYVDLEITSAIM